MWFTEWGMLPIGRNLGLRLRLILYAFVIKFRNVNHCFPLMRSYSNFEMQHNFNIELNYSFKLEQGNFFVVQETVVKCRTL